MPNFVQIRAEMADLFTFFEICIAPYGSGIYEDCPKKSTSGIGINNSSTNKTVFWTNCLESQHTTRSSLICEHLLTLHCGSDVTPWVRPDQCMKYLRGFENVTQLHRVTEVRTHGLTRVWSNLCYIFCNTTCSKKRL